MIRKLLIIILSSLLAVFSIVHVVKGAVNAFHYMPASLADIAVHTDHPSFVTQIYLPLVQKDSTRFNFREQLFGTPSSLSLWISQINSGTGYVEIGGNDWQQPTIPFTWDWGDGTLLDGWFPQTHTYLDPAKNYNVRVTSHYNDGSSDHVEVLVRFVASTIDPIALPAALEVFIPDHEVITMTSRVYPVPTGLSYFDESYFGLTSRTDAEYVLSVVATIQSDFCQWRRVPIQQRLQPDRAEKAWT